MSESKHTPGPWFVSIDEGWPYRVSQQPEGGAFWVAEIIGGVMGNEEEANANLIAAAPDLYEALTEALRWIGRLNDWEGAGDPDVDTWRAALAKAKGEES